MCGDELAFVLKQRCSFNVAPSVGILRVIGGVGFELQHSLWSVRFETMLRKKEWVPGRDDPFNGE